MKKDVKVYASKLPAGVGTKINAQTRPEHQHQNTHTNGAEDALIAAIDERQFLKKHEDWLKNLQSGKLDVHTALADLAPDMVMRLAYMALSQDTSSKTRLAAIQDWLDRAGFGKVQKHALATVDATQSKEALLSLLLGSSKDLKAEGIEIIDDETDKTK